MKKNRINIFLLALSYMFMLYSCGSDDSDMSTLKIINQVFSIDENSEMGTKVGTLNIADKGQSQSVTFSIISGNEDGVFEIDSNSGEILVANPSKLDFETTSSFALTVEASDASSAKSQAQITINLLDVKISSSGLIAFYPFNGDAIDESDNSNDGIVVGPQLTEDRNGNLNSAYDFDGINDYIELGNSDVFSLGAYANFTVSFWIKPNGIVSDKRRDIFSRYLSSMDSRFYAFSVRPDNNISFSIYNEGATNIVETLMKPIQTNWQNITWVYLDGEITLYIDGVNSGNLSSTVPISQKITAADAVIGAAHLSSELYDSNYPGIIDDIRIFDRALDTKEVSTIYLEVN